MIKIDVLLHTQIILIIKLLTLEKALVSCGKMNIRKSPVIAAIHLIVLLWSKSKRLFISTGMDRERYDTAGWWKVTNTLSLYYRPPRVIKHRS